MTLRGRMFGGVGPVRAARGGPRRGFALLLALLLVVLLALVVAELVFTTRTTYQVSKNYEDDLQSIQAMQAGMDLAVLILREDHLRGQEADYLQEDWAGSVPQLTTGRARLEIEIRDEERRFNLNWFHALPDPGRLDALRMLVDIIDALGYDGYVEADRIKDYVDPDDVGDHEQDAKNRPLDAPEELRLIPGIDPKLVDGWQDEERVVPGLLDYVTVWGAGLNVNTVDPDYGPEEEILLLRAFVGQGAEEVADEIVFRRSGFDSEGNATPWRNAGDVQKVFTDYDAKIPAIPVALRSSFFRLRLAAGTGENAREAEVILERDLQGKFRRIRWVDDPGLAPPPGTAFSED